MERKSNERIDGKRPANLVLGSSLNKQITDNNSVEITNNNNNINNAQTHQQQSLSPTKPTQLQPSQKTHTLLNLFKSTEPQTKTYKQAIEQIITSFSTMDSLTNKLQQKVDHMLHNQKLQFIQSYKRHMNKVREEFLQVEKRIQSYEQKILYYENEGEMSHLVIKVSQLEEECKRLYKLLDSKQKILRDNQLTIKVQKSQIKRYQKQLKLLMRQKNQLKSIVEKIARPQHNQQNHQQQNDQHYSIIQSIKSTKNLVLFPTELLVDEKEKRKGSIIDDSHPCQLYDVEAHTNSVKNPNASLTINIQEVNYEKKDDKISCKQSKTSSKNAHARSPAHSTANILLEQSNSKHSFILNPHAKNSNNNNNPSLSSPNSTSNNNQSLINSHIQNLRKQISLLKKKNQLLTSYQSHVLESNTSMESFFIQCVNEIKQQIRMKKKVNYQLTLEEWKKEDKIQLLIKVLSNQQILTYLYQRLFKYKNHNSNLQKSQNDNSKAVDIVNKQTSRSKGFKSLYQLGGQKDAMVGQKVQETLKKQKLLGLMKQKSIDMVNQKERPHKKAMSLAQKRVSKHISENSILPKIHFNLQY